MTNTTQAIRDALAKRKASPYGIVFTDGWKEFAITELLTELDAAQAGIEAAVLAERERCYSIVRNSYPANSGVMGGRMRFFILEQIGGKDIPITTGWPPAALMQDDCRKLSKALSNTPCARLSAQDAGNAIREGVKS